MAADVAELGAGSGARESGGGESGGSDAIGGTGEDEECRRPEEHVDASFDAVLCPFPRAPAPWQALSSQLTERDLVLSKPREYDCGMAAFGSEVAFGMGLVGHENVTPTRPQEYMRCFIWQRRVLITVVDTSSVCLPSVPSMDASGGVGTIPFWSEADEHQPHFGDDGADEEDHLHGLEGGAEDEEGGAEDEGTVSDGLTAAGTDAHGAGNSGGSVVGGYRAATNSVPDRFSEFSFGGMGLQEVEETGEEEDEEADEGNEDDFEKEPYPLRGASAQEDDGTDDGGMYSSDGLLMPKPRLFMNALSLDNEVRFVWWLNH
jgi:hypothetical protein